jgi:protein O-GlcNAc transferase
MFSRWLKKSDEAIPAVAGAATSSPAGSNDDGAVPTVGQQLQVGLAHHQAGRAAEAERTYRQVLETDARNFDALHLLGVLLHQTQRSEQGAALVAQAIAADGTKAVAWHNLAEIYCTLGRLQESAQCNEKVLTLEPTNAVAHYNLGLLLDRQGRFDEAQERFRLALTCNAKFAAAHIGLGVIRSKQGRLDEAQECYERALGIDPTLVDALNNLGQALFEQGRLEAALVRYREALALRPTLVEAHVNLGNALRAQRKLEEAVASYRSAIALAPTLAYAHYGLGHVLAEQDESTLALASFEAALAYDPTLVEARWARAMAQLEHVYANTETLARCRAAFASELHSLVAWFDANGYDRGHVAVGSQQPFMLAYQEQENRGLLAEYGKLCSNLMRNWQDREMLIAPRPARQDRIRVGIVSAHVHDHPVWNAILKGWFLHLNRDRFALQVFYLQSRFDEETKFAQSHAAHFESGGRGLRQWAVAILEAQPDVLIYPEIGIDPMTAKLANLRLSPIQTATWGHPETTGLPTIDYYLSAEEWEPPDARRHYTEQLVALPRLGCSYGRLGSVVAEPNLAKLGLAEDCPLLVCAGMPFKYAPEHDWIFPEIATRLGRCQFVFFFASTYPEWTQRLRDRLQVVFEKANVPFKRHVIFIASLPRPEFYGLMTRAQVYLDTIGFSGFNTAMQAVECGLPIVTREGRFMRGRFASGILRRMGLSELVADTEAGYVELAVRLVQDAEYREQVRRRIQDSRGVLYHDTAPIRALEEFLLDVTKPGFRRAQPS